MTTTTHMTIDAGQFAALCNLFHTTHCDEIDLSAAEAGDVLYFRANPMVCDHSRLIARAVLAYLGIGTGDLSADEIINEVGAAMVNGQGSLPDPDDDEAPGDIDGLDDWAYALGKDPLVYAETSTATLISAHELVIASRAEDPATFPGYSLDLSTEALARRIIGTLMDAGWTPPEVPS
jgi:hypothetical protein